MKDPNLILLRYYFSSPEEFVFIVLMCSWLTNVTLEHVGTWTILDAFCGAAHISKLAANVGLKTKSYDIRIGRTRYARKGRNFRGKKRHPMDINGHVGFAFPS